MPLLERQSTKIITRNNDIVLATHLQLRPHSVVQLVFTRRGRRWLQTNPVILIKKRQRQRQDASFFTSILVQPASRRPIATMRLNGCDQLVVLGDLLCPSVYLSLHTDGLICLVVCSSARLSTYFVLSLSLSLSPSLC